MLWQRLIAYCKVTAPVYVFFLVLDRAYQFYRFGSFTNTYVTLFARELRQRDPTLPANFPWSTPFHAGFLGALFQPEKSIFLFDPLLVLAIFLLALLWKRLTPEVRAYGATSLLLLLAYISFYARYTYWSGDFAWGDRYVSTAVELVTLVAVPLLMRYRERLGRTIWRAGWVLIVVSLMIQLASLAFWLPLEIYQMETLGHPTFVIALRFKNIFAFALGKMDAWGLNNRGHDTGPVGLCSHHDVEFSAVSAAPRRGSAGLGGEFGICNLACRDCRTWIGFAPVTKQLANGRVRARLNTCKFMPPDVWTAFFHPAKGGSTITLGLWRWRCVADYSVGTLRLESFLRSLEMSVFCNNNVPGQGSADASDHPDEKQNRQSNGSNAVAPNGAIACRPWEH